MQSYRLREGHAQKESYVSRDLTYILLGVRWVCKVVPYRLFINIRKLETRQMPPVED